MRALAVIGFLLSGQIVQAEVARIAPYGATLKAREANIRVGPGGRYPLAWKFVRPGIPLIVFAEVGTWRKIQDADGADGWIHQNMIERRRSVVVTGQKRALLKKPETTANVIAHIEPDVCARLLEIRGDWIRVKVGHLTGWLLRDHVWGLLEGEKDKIFGS
jgi:SH3-like domain-containing protein